MLSKIEKGLKKLGLKYNPFKDISPEDPNFGKLFVNRTKELYKIDLALEFYKSGVNKNLVILGQSRMGKTTLLFYTMKEIEGKFKCVYFDFPPSVREFVSSVKEIVCEDKGGKKEKTIREYGNRFIKISRKYARNLVIFIDNFEEMLEIDREEFAEFVRMFRRSKALFIVACTPDEWRELTDLEPLLKNIFSEEVLLSPFNLNYCTSIFTSRISVAREGSHPEAFPFDEESIRLIGIYSFFVPGKIIDLANKVLFEAVAEERNQISTDFVKKVVFESPTISKYLEGLSKKEIETIETMIEIGEPTSFEVLAKKMGVSRVAVAGYIQKLMERGLVEHLEAPGKKKLFVIGDRFRSLLV